MLHGEVMRVLLLFYLAPLWTVLFSYWLSVSGSPLRLSQLALSLSWREIEQQQHAHHFAVQHRQHVAKFDQPALNSNRQGPPTGTREFTARRAAA